jgi:F0F1-type ATP synthase assembly protein I
MTGGPDPKDLGFYFALSQIGFEMVVPLCVGLAIDYYFGTKPWATIIGFVLGFVGGFLHLLTMLQRHQASQKGPPPGEDQQ